ncbi:MAG: trypsin-like peptidase domain-containing protein [Spirochaetia bacterium]|nr:trypsin-like peptidase domain-containing protein [Spirochaetia bacterium]
MKRFLFVSLFFLILSAFSFGGSSCRKIVDRVQPSTVSIEILDVTRQKVPDGWDFSYDPFAPSKINKDNELEFREDGIGSGVIVSRDGNKYFVLTNDHVVNGSESILIKLYDGSSASGTIVGTDPKTDMALVYFESALSLPVARLGDSDRLHVGDRVLSFGSPLGYDFSVSAGIVSALGRQNAYSDIRSDFIQTDAAVNQGNSGGPLVDMRGRVVGINTWIASPSGGNVGLGFAVPSNNIKKIISQLLTSGTVSYGWLGVISGEMLPETCSDMGIPVGGGTCILSTIPGEPADVQGLMPGDCITEINGKPVLDYDDFVLRIGQLDPGDTVAIRFYRDGALMERNITLTLADDSRIPEFTYWPGISVMALEEKVVVAMVENNAVMHVHPGDIIVSIDGKEIRSLRDFYSALNGLQDLFEISVIRGENTISEVMKK